MSFLRTLFAGVCCMVCLSSGIAHAGLPPVYQVFADAPGVFPHYSFAKDSVHSPRKATLLSAFLPGAGQFYNKKYWKMPLIYGAGAVGGYLIHTNYNDYSRFRKAYIYRSDDDPDTNDDYPQYDANQLKVYRDSYRRNMELSVILTAAVYLLQVLDATVDGHLYDFKVSGDMVFQARPEVRFRTEMGIASPCVGLAFSIPLKIRR